LCQTNIHTIPIYEGRNILLFDDVVAKKAFGKKEIIAVEAKRQ